MTTTARKATAAVTATVALLDLVILGIELDFDDCNVCGHPAAELFDRMTEDGDEVRACETCVDTLRLGYVAG